MDLDKANKKTFNRFLKNANIPINSARAKALEAQYLISGSPYIKEHNNIYDELFRRSNKEEGTQVSGNAFSQFIGKHLLDKPGFFRHSSNPFNPDTVHVNKGDVPVFMEELLHAEQYKNANKDSLYQANLSQMKELEHLEQYRTPGTVESIHKEHGPKWHDKYKKAISEDYGQGLLGRIRNWWHDYNTPKPWKE